jgi:drug/metabolite transporter (DMT)-like permease
MIRGIKMKNTALIVCTLMAGMILCVFLAVLDNITIDNGFTSILLQIAVVTPYIFIHFIIGAGLWYYAMQRYIVHNSIFYFLFVVLLIYITFNIIEKIKHKN